MCVVDQKPSMAEIKNNLVLSAIDEVDEDLRNSILVGRIPNH